MLGPKPEFQSRFRCLFTSYSREETIARASLLVRKVDLSVPVSLRMFKELGDFRPSEKSDFLEGHKITVDELRSGLSVAWDEFKPLPEN